MCLKLRVWGGERPGDTRLVRWVGPDQKGLGCQSKQEEVCISAVILGRSSEKQCG